MADMVLFVKRTTQMKNIVNAVIPSLQSSFIYSSGVGLTFTLEYVRRGERYARDLMYNTNNFLFCKGKTKFLLSILISLVYLPIY